MRLNLRQSSSQWLFALAFLPLVACSDDNESDKKKDPPALPTLTSPAPQPRGTPSRPEPTPAAETPDSALTLTYVKDITGTWLDSCKATDQGSNRFAYSFENSNWLTYVFKYKSSDCTGEALQTDGGVRAYKLNLKPAQNGWLIANGTCASEANGCKQDKVAALRLVEGRLETKNVKAGTEFNPDDGAPTYTYEKGTLPLGQAPTPAAPAVAPTQPAAPAALSQAANRFLKVVDGTWLPQECVKDNRNPEQSLKYIVIFTAKEFKTDIYRYKNVNCEGEPEIKPNGAWAFTFDLKEYAPGWFALDAQRVGDASNKTQRLFSLDGNVLRQYRLQKTETFESVRGTLEQLKTDNLEKAL